ncbi:MAG: flagellar protein FlaG [Halieaceae bacterium]
MTKMDGVKQPEQIRPVRAAAETSTASATQGRQSVSPNGNAAPPAEAAEQRMAVIEAANAISSFVQKVSRELRFAVDDNTGRTVITVMDQNTDQVIRQIPGDEVLALAKVLEESPTPAPRGILINSEA